MALMRRRAILAAVLLAAALPAAPVRAEEGEGGGKKQPGAYIEFGSVAVTKMGPGGRRAVMTVDLALHAPDAGLRQRARLYVPYLRSAYVSTLQRYALGLSPEQAPSPDWIAAALQRETDRVLGRPGVRLLLGSVLIN